MVSDAEYAKKHQLKELFEHLMKKVLERKPTDPEILMLNILKRRQDMKQKNPVRLLLFWIKPMKKSFMTNLKKKFQTFDPSLRRGPKAVPKPSSSTNQPRPSSAQPQISKSRSTNYDRPWMSASKNLSKTLPNSNSTRPNSSSAMTRTVDLTVSSNQHEMKRKMNAKIMKDKNAKKIVDKISNEATTQIIKVAGKRQILDIENEEIKLKFDVRNLFLKSILKKIFRKISKNMKRSKIISTLRNS